MLRIGHPKGKLFCCGVALTASGVAGLDARIPLSGDAP